MLVRIVVNGWLMIGQQLVDDWVMVGKVVVSVIGRWLADWLVIGKWLADWLVIG